jgi:hypothetical protein
MQPNGGQAKRHLSITENLYYAILYYADFYYANRNSNSKSYDYPETIDDFNNSNDFNNSENYPATINHRRSENPESAGRSIKPHPV